MECIHGQESASECDVCRRRRDSFHRIDRRYSNGFRRLAVLALATAAGVTTLALLLALWDTEPARTQQDGSSPADATTPPP